LFNYTYYPNGSKAKAVRRINYFGDIEPYKEYSEFFKGYSDNSTQLYRVYTKIAYGEKTKIRTKQKDKGHYIKLKEKIRHRNQKKMRLQRSNEYTFNEKRLMTMEKLTYHTMSIPTSEWRWEYVYYE